MTKSAISIAAPLTKTLIFAVVMTVVLAFVTIQLGGFTFYGKHDYRAIFINASALKNGAPVMISGVRVGEVTGVHVYEDDAAQVGFNVKSSIPLDSNIRAAIRYKNLTGDRYLELIPQVSTPGSGSELGVGSTIPESRTEPALDLDLLLGGMQPLFQGLDPTQINQLSTSLVQVLQGEGGNLDALLQHIASFSSTLAEKDQLIGQVVDNLNSVLGNLDIHSAQLSSTVTALQTVATDLSGDRNRLGQSFVGVDNLVTSMGGLLTALRGPLSGFVTQLGRFATQANAGAGTINDVLRMLPGGYLRIGRLGSRGAGYNLYLCALRLKFSTKDGGATYSPWIAPAASVYRCKPGIAPLQTPEQRAAQGGN